MGPTIRAAMPQRSDGRVEKQSKKIKGAHQTDGQQKLSPILQGSVAQLYLEGMTKHRSGVDP